MGLINLLKSHFHHLHIMKLFVSSGIQVCAKPESVHESTSIAKCFPIPFDQIIPNIFANTLPQQDSTAAHYIETACFFSLLPFG